MYIFNKVGVIVFVVQILVFLTSIYAQNNISVSQPNSTTLTKSNNATATTNSEKLPHPNEEILTESGGKIETQVGPAVVPSEPHNREGIAKQPIVANKTAKSASTPRSSSVSSVHVSSSTRSSTTSTTERYIPVAEQKPPVINPSVKSEHKAISPRKGVNFSDFEHQVKQNATTIKPKAKKPTATLASDEEPYPASHFQSNTKTNSTATQSIPKVPNLYMLSESNQGKTQKYIVPIVIVILSVPFVAILISILYKKGAEWWKYRHYRRMDFLINGMYDN